MIKPGCTKQPLLKLAVKGYKSICLLDEFCLNDGLNVLIGPNGAGKSNFISFFSMLRDVVDGRLKSWTKKQEGADAILYRGVKQTDTLEVLVKFGYNEYKFSLATTPGGEFYFASEKIYYQGSHYGETGRDLGHGHLESYLKRVVGSNYDMYRYVYDSISSWCVYHFHDTENTAGMKRWGDLYDNDYLRSDAANLAAYLYKLKHENVTVYERIVDVVQLALPLFKDFTFKVRTTSQGNEQIRLYWQQIDSDYSLSPTQLSDGSLRFICLCTALMQPDPPSTIIFDEPELGLHPYAINLLGALFREAAGNMQIIVSTQSVQLLNEFDISDLIIVEQEDGESVFKRYAKADFDAWLEEYTLGEIWEKNLLGGRPR